MYIRSMTLADKEFVMSIDKHIDDEKYDKRVYSKCGYIICEENEPAGLMFHIILWDNLPFLNLIFVREEFRGKGIGRKAMLSWEEEMRKQGSKMVLISTQVDETAQHFYRKLGYIDCGSLLFNSTPFEQPMEMFMRKIL